MKFLVSIFLLITNAFASDAALISTLRKFNEKIASFGNSINSQCHKDGQQISNQENVLKCDQLSPIPLFADEKPLEMKIYSAFFNEGFMKAHLELDEKKDKKSGKIIVNDSSFEVEVAPRGRARNYQCGFKPLKIFLKTSQENTLFANGDNDLKLVTHCLDTADPKIIDQANQRVLAEYQMYKAVEKLGYPSFKVRLVKNQYFDEKGNFRTEAYSFFIESKKDLAKRCNAKLVKNNRDQSPEPSPKSMLQLYLSQMLIVNTDFSVDIDKNSILLEKNDTPMAIVTYDYDMSGIVRNKNDGVSDNSWKNWSVDDAQDLSNFNGVENGSHFQIDNQWHWSKFRQIRKEGSDLEWKQTVKDELMSVYSKKEILYQDLSNSLLDELHKEKIRVRYDAFFGAIIAKYEIEKIPKPDEKNKSKFKWPWQKKL